MRVCVVAFTAGLAILILLAVQNPFVSICVSAPIQTAGDAMQAASPSTCSGVTGQKLAKPASIDTDDERPVVHIGHAICGTVGRDGAGMHFYGFTVVKSALQARARSASPRRRFHFHIVVDGGMHALLEDRARLVRVYPGIVDVFDYVANFTDGRVQMSIYHVNDVDKAVSTAVGEALAGAISSRLFRPCATARLKVPFLQEVAAVGKLLWVDWDSVMLCDPANHVDFFEWPEDALIAAAEEMAHSGQVSMYQGMPAAFNGSGINSGVLLMHLSRMRAVGLNRIWNEEAEIARAGGYAAPGLKENAGASHSVDGLAFGDQDILNILGSNARHPDWFAVLPPQWNWRQSAHASLAMDLRTNAPPGYNPPVPCIEHYAGFQAFGNNVVWPQRAALYAYVAHQRLTASSGEDMPVIQTCLPDCVPPLVR